MQAVAVLLDLYLLGSFLPMVKAVQWAIAACPIMMVLLCMLLQRFAGAGKLKGRFFIPVVGIVTSVGWMVGLSPAYQKVLQIPLLDDFFAQLWFALTLALWIDVEVQVVSSWRRKQI